MAARERLSLRLLRRAAEIVASASEPVEVGGVTAAVLLAAFEGADGQASVILTRRSGLLVEDPGHVALPGGRLAHGEDPADAALREAGEEVALDVGCVEAVVPLGAYVRGAARSGAVASVAAYAAFLTCRPELVASEAEVEAIMEVPVAGLLLEDVAWQERWSSDAGLAHDVAFFASEAILGEDLVWGLTARILWTLLEALGTVLGESDGVGAAPLQTSGGAVVGR